MSKAVLIDGLSILNRAFYGVPNLTNSEGQHTNAVYGFLNILFKILDEEDPDYLAVALDVSAPTFRHQMYEGYKGTRKPMPEELKEQVPLLKEVLAAMHIQTVEKEGYEADDILGTLSRFCENQGVSVSILSGDRDLLQLATEKTKIRIPKTKATGTEIEDYDAAAVLEKYQVTPQEFVDLKALMGDSSDNIPGVPGIGEKTGIKIISAYKSIENAYDHVEEIKPKRAATNLKTYWDQAQLSKKLSKIDVDCPISISLDDIKLGEIYTKEAYELLKNLEFKQMFSRFDLEAVEEQNSIAPAVLLEEAQDLYDILDQQKGKKEKEKQILGLYVHEEEPRGVCIYSSGKKQSYFVLGKAEESRKIVEQLLRDDYRIAVCNFKDTLTGLSVPENTQLLQAKDQPVFDCSVAAYLLNPLTNSYHYDDLAKDYLSMTLSSQKEVFGKQPHVKLYEEQQEEFQKFLAWNAATAALCLQPLFKGLKESGMEDLYERIELPLVSVLYAMEQYGIRVKKEELADYGEALTSRIHELEQNIYDLAGETFNINSPKQLGTILFEKMHLPYGKKTKTGYSTSAEVLEKLRTEDPIIDLILEYRQLTKLKSTYADGLETYIQEDGRIHGKFNQTTTATGRISSTEPNLQNIPIRMELGRRIRKVFVPDEGSIFVDADYSQIELRVLAHMSGDQKLIEAYRKDQDIHKITASQVFHTPLNEVTPLMRRKAKAVNFGIIYGISSFGLSQDLSISRREAEEYIQNYFQTFPQVKIFLDDLVAEAKKRGYSLTLYGRRRPIPELKSSNYAQRSFGERIAMNSPIQGTAADIIKIAMIRVYRRLKKQQMKSRLILQVHDELLIEADQAEVETVCAILKEEMEGAANLAVPLEVDIHTGKNWYEAK